MGRKARVAFIGHSYIESLTRKKLAYLAEKLDMRLISPAFYQTPFGRREVDFEFNGEVPVMTYPLHFANSKPTSTRWVLGTWDMGFREFKPDIIHIDNEQHSWITCQALLYRRIYVPRARTVVFTWDNLRIREQGKKGWMLEQLARYNRRSIDFIVCGNEDGRQILIEKGYPESRTSVIPQFGVDEDVFFPFSRDRRKTVRIALGLENDDFAIGFVGRFVEEKGIFDLVEACGKVRAASKAKRNPVLVLVGSGPIEKEVRLRCSQHLVRLLVLPPRRSHEVVEILNALDVLVLPSQTRAFWKEQFGRVLIEAMACEVPVIGSDSGEIPHVIGDAEYVFHESDSAQLACLLERLQQDERYRLFSGERGRRRVEAQFTSRSIADRTLAIYERLAAHGTLI